MSLDHHRKAWWHGNLTRDPTRRHDAVDVAKVLQDLSMRNGWDGKKTRTEIDVGILMELMNCRMLDTLTLKHNSLAKHGVVDIFVYAVWNQHCCVWIKQETSWLQTKEKKYIYITSSINCPEVSPYDIILDIILAMWQLYLSLKYSTCFCQTVASSGQPCLNWWLWTPKTPLSGPFWYLGKPDTVDGKKTC